MSKGETHAWRLEKVLKLEPIKDLSDSKTEKDDWQFAKCSWLQRKKKLEMIQARICNPLSPELKKCQNAKHPCGNAKGCKI